MGNGAGPTQRDVAIQIETAPNERVSSLQFDIVFEPHVLVLKKVVEGRAVQQADKRIHVRNLEQGRTRILVAGFNLNAIQDGNIAVATFGVVEPARARPTPVLIEAAILADPSGKSVPVRVESSRPGPDNDRSGQAEEPSPPPVRPQTRGCLGACRQQGDADAALGAVLGDGLLFLMTIACGRVLRRII